MQYMKHTIIVDTREKKPWTFERYKVKVQRGTLRSGDYSLKGFHKSGIAIERKALADLFGSMTSGRLRFYNELRRLGEFRLAALIVEAPHDAVLRGSRMTRISPGSMLRTIYAWCCGFGIQVHFCENSEKAEEKAYRLLVGWAESREI